MSFQRDSPFFFFDFPLNSEAGSHLGQACLQHYAAKDQSLYTPKPVAATSHPPGVRIKGLVQYQSKFSFIKRENEGPVSK